MMKIFRKIRQNLLDENRSGNKAGKFTKYMLYAVGEIVLVVIGILIAVSIDDWNTNRKQKAEIHELLRAFEKDLITSIEDATQVLDVSIQRDSMIRMVLNNQVSQEDYESNRVGALILSYNRITTTDENLIKLLDKEELMWAEMQPLLQSLKKYQSLINSYSHQQQRLSEYVATQNEFFTDNMEWFSSYWQSGDDRAVAYFLNDPIYKNKVRFYQVLLMDNYASSVAEYRNRAISILYALQPHIDEDDNYEDALERIELLPLRKVRCADEIILESDSGAYFAPLVFNASTDTLEIHMSYLSQDELREWDMSLPPNQQLDSRLFAPHYFEIKKNGKCLTRFRGGQDYLILNQNLVQ